MLTMSRIADIRCIVAEREVDGVTFEAVGRRGRPGFRLEHAGARRLRIVARDVPLAYAVIDDWWEEVAWLSTGRRVEVVPPITGNVMQRVSGEPASPGWWRGWTRHFVDALDPAAASPLFNGVWVFAPVSYGSSQLGRPYPRIPDHGINAPPPLAHSIERVLGVSSFVHDDWCAGWGECLPMGVVWPLRPPSLPADGRVKAYRKQAVAGTLPPALLLYVSVLGAYLVLDGHDRLHAALLEKKTPCALAMWPTRDDAQKQAFQDEAIFAANIRDDAARNSAEARLRRRTLTRCALTRAWQMPGGRDAWRHEVRATLAAAQGVEPAQAEFMLDA